MKKEIKRAYLEMHVAVFLWGFTAILGKLISLEEIDLLSIIIYFHKFIIIFSCLEKYLLSS